jgi:hypothetical protein
MPVLTPGRIPRSPDGWWYTIAKNALLNFKTGERVFVRWINGSMSRSLIFLDEEGLCWSCDGEGDMELVGSVAYRSSSPQLMHHLHLIKRSENAAASAVDKYPFSIALRGTPQMVLRSKPTTTDVFQIVQRIDRNTTETLTEMRTMRVEMIGEMRGIRSEVGGLRTDLGKFMESLTGILHTFAAEHKWRDRMEDRLACLEKNGA